jgi:UDP-glucose 4-epimerase
MKLLVTGGAGCIGGVVVAQLVAVGHEVTVADDLSTDYADVLSPGVDFARVVASSALARAELGWTPTKPDLHTIVDDAWAFFRTRQIMP